MSPNSHVFSKETRSKILEQDRAIASAVRQYSDPQQTDWQDAENVSLFALLKLANQDPDDLDEPNGQADVMANTLARILGYGHRSGADYDTGFLATLSALAYASAGNFPSASVLAKEATSQENAGPLEMWMMRVLANLKSDLLQASPPPVAVRYASALQTALKSGIKSDFGAATEAFNVLCEEAVYSLPANDRYLLLLWHQIHQRLHDLSVARILKEIAFPHQGYADAISAVTSPLFFPAQAEALTKTTLTARGGNVLLSLATSTGKSLLGELALVASLQWERPQRWLAVYLAPYRALTDQLFDKMRSRLLQVDIACIKRRGNYLDDMGSITHHRPTVLVATPEAFDGLLRSSPELYQSISACVFDEFHLIEQHQRGLRYEGLIGRFNHGAAGAAWPKIVALSAVVTDSEQLRRWLSIDTDQGYFHSAWKPTARRIAVASPAGHLDYYSLGEETETNRFQQPEFTGNIALPYQVDTAPNQPTRNIDWPAYNRTIQQQTDNIHENIAFLALDQFHRFGEPIMVLSSTRLGCQLIATMIAERLSAAIDVSETARLANTIALRYPHLFTLRYCLARGVAYHNASLPDWVRSELERLLLQKQIKFVVATTTLAEGVDMPFRVVVMADWESWRFGQNQPIPTLLFHNIAGRCGRAGEYIEGDTIIVDNPGRRPGVVFLDRYRKYYELYIEPRPYVIRSSIELTIDSEADTDSKIRIGSDTAAVLESQFAAYVAVCGQTENPESEFSASIFAGLNRTAQTFVVEKTVAFTSDMLAESQYPVMVRNSPLALTDFGQVTLKTGLSPRSGIKLAEFCAAYEPTKEPGKGSRIRARFGIVWDPLCASMWENVVNEQWVQELEGDPLYRYIKKRGQPATESNFPMVMMAWLSGVPIQEIAYLTIRDPNMRNLAETWLNKQVEAPDREVESWIEKIAILCDGYLGEQWSWVLRGTALISAQIELTDLSELFEETALRMRFGVLHLESAALLRRQCPLDRAKLDWLVSQYRQTEPDKDWSPETFRKWLAPIRDIDAVAYSRFPNLTIVREELIDLDIFLQRLAAEDSNS